MLLSEFIDRYYLYNPDSSFKLAKEALALAQRINYPRGEAYIRRSMSNLLRSMGDYSTAVFLVVPNIKLAEAIDDPDLLQRSYGTLASTYRDGGNYSEALQYSLKGTLTNERFDNCNLCAVWNVITASIYYGMNKLDSALLYLKRSFQYDYKKPFAGWSYLINGMVHAKLDNFDSAFHYFRLSFRVLEEELNLKDLAGAYFNMATLYHRTGNADSAIYFAHEGAKIAQKNSYPMEAMNVYQVLAQVYEKNNADSALRYYKLFIVAKDSLFSQEKVKALLVHRFNEEFREQEKLNTKMHHHNQIKILVLLGTLAIFLVAALFLYRNNRQKQKAKLKIEHAYETLKNTQAQLIQSEKMASLGELTAGIAHEIQNPLNFVNNFSDVNSELADELQQEADNGNLDEVKAIAKDIRENEQKINHHGKRADAIVKGMLQHSRSSTGIKEQTNINALVEEYLRLAYHGLRAKDKLFDATTKTDFDETIGNVNIIPQDIGRVILNLITNAFYAVAEKRKQQPENYVPTVSVSTKKINDKVEIKVKDNGNGISQKVLDKIFQPFFTTKPTGQGTGLGLSLSYDIVKAHGGEIKVDTNEGQGSEFIIQLPIN